MYHRKGFTLIELLVVIAIIGILATLVVTQVAGAQVKARNASATSDITEMGKAVELFKISDDTAATGNAINAATGAANTSLSTTLNGTTGATLLAIFGGTESFTSGSAAYALKVSKTPSTAYTYTYLSHATGAQTVRQLTATCYVASTNVKSTSGGADTTYSVKNGGSADSAQTCP